MGKKKYVHTKKQWQKWYREKEKLMGQTWEEVEPRQFYRELFPEGSFQIRGEMGADDKGNGMVDIISEYGKGARTRKYCKKYVLTDELDGLRYALTNNSKSENRLCLCSPVSYYGQQKTNNMAHELFAIVLDIDYVGLSQLKNIIKQIGNGARTIPPNYIVNSGRGLHLYYFLKEPIPCYRYMLENLTKFKSIMQDFTWNETTSLTPEKPDHGAITQAFRMVGSETKLGRDYPVRAYKVREARWTIEELYYWIDKRTSFFFKGFDVPTLKEPIEVYRKNHPLTLEQAKKKYPDWNPSEKSKGKWDIAGKVHGDDPLALYHWWIRQIQDKAVVGGRYYAVLALAAYGSKCDVPLKQIRKDAMELLPDLEALTNDDTNHFTVNDIEDALRFYKSNKQEVTYKLTRARIQELSKIDIPKNKRNGRKQLKHIKVMNAIRDIEHPNGSWRNKDGAPTKKDIVQEWQAVHPNGTKTECKIETGLTYPTIRKWWTEQGERE